MFVIMNIIGHMAETLNKKGDGKMVRDKLGNVLEIGDPVVFKYFSEIKLGKVAGMSKLGLEDVEYDSLKVRGIVDEEGEIYDIHTHQAIKTYNLDDKLDTIIGEQDNLCSRILEEHNFHFESDNDMIQKHILAINDELGELQRAVDWKWWTNEKDIDWDNVDEELVDILFFTFQALILRGHRSEDIYNLYMDKLDINHERQDGKRRKGYKADSNEKYESVD